MKQAWKERCLFIILCVSIVAYLGYKEKIKIVDTKNEYVDYQLVLNEVMVNNVGLIRDTEGDFEDWIEIYNKGETAINLFGFGLSNDSKQPFLWKFPEKILQPKSFLIVWASGKNKTKSKTSLHTNFSLNSKDKVLTLTAPDCNWKDIFVLKNMGENIAFGRKPDGSSELYGFDEGTPGKANNSDILIEGTSTKRLSGPFFSQKSGFYSQAFDLILKSEDKESIIFYTLDGSVPTKESTQFSKPIIISAKTNEATIVRARVYKAGYPKSEIVTHSYFIEKNIFNKNNFSVISLVTDPRNFFGYEQGIYVAGKVFDQWKKNHPNDGVTFSTPANYNQRGKKWERKACVELFEPNGTLALSQNIGIRIFGGYSRANNLKSLSLYARKDYDVKEYFYYDFFEDKVKKRESKEEKSQISRLLLRTSATDSKYSLFRDALIQSLIRQIPIVVDIQSSKPCIVYINGKYYGIHNIREAYDKNYISNHYNLDEGDVVILKNPTGIAGVEIDEGYAGDEMHYNRIINFIQQHDQGENVYSFVKRYMDIENFIEYNVLQIYCDNRDWPGNNVRIWRKRTDSYKPNAPYGHDGRWRWMVFDLDYGFGLYEGVKAAKNNSLMRATEENGPEWPNPPWSTLLLRVLLKNEDVKNQFINVFADRLNSVFLPEVVIKKIEEMEQIYSPNIMEHINRWQLHDNDVEKWKEEIWAMKNFAQERPEHIRQHIIDYFGLNGTASLKIEINKGGLVKINSLEIEDIATPWKGIYFKDIPITIEAIPKRGYKFAGWEGINKSEKKIQELNLSESLSLKAIFKRK